MVYAAIDIGTNSCRLMIASITAGSLQVLHREMDTTRIGAGLAAQGRISPEAALRTLQCLQRFQHAISCAQAEDYRLVATSAVREAANRAWFEELCQQSLHKEIEVISGEEEARLTYKGVVNGLRLDRPLLVADLGGGSTELIHGGPELFVQSLPLGAVRAAEAQSSDGQILALLQDIARQPERFRDAVLVFCGGTATSVVAMKYALSEYDSRLVHGQRLQREEIRQIYESLLAMPLQERKKVAGLQPDRADIIVYGLRIMLNLILAVDKEWAVVSESDLLEGLIWEMAEKNAGS